MGPGEYAPTDEACTSTGTPAAATASNSRMLPSTLVRQVVAGSCVGWNAHARCTTASAPASRPASWACSDDRSTAAHSVFGGDQSGTRRASPSTDSTSGSSASRRTTLVPTLPVAPVTTTLPLTSVSSRCSPATGVTPASPLRSRPSTPAAGHRTHGTHRTWHVAPGYAANASTPVSSADRAHSRAACSGSVAQSRTPPLESPSTAGSATSQSSR